MDGISLNGTFEVTPKEGFKKRKRQRFLVEKIEPSPPENGVMLPYIFDHQSKIFFDDIDSVVEISMNGDRSLVEFEINGLKGMRLQVETLTDIINKGLNFAAKSGASSSEARLTKPVIIQGISGTGKSELIENLSAARGCNVLRIEESIVSSISSKTEANLEKFFDEAIAKQPALILIDDIHFIAGKSDSSGFARSLSRHIRRAARHRVQTVATARDLTDVHDQIAPWFVKVIDLPIPNTQARLDILKDFAGEQCEENILIHIADRTHAFVALDLRKLWLCALDSAENKALNRSSAFSTRSDATYVSQQTSAILQWADKVRVSAEDFEVALSLVHASAMNEVYVEVPKVRWRDIGGSEEVKKHLQRVTKISSRVSPCDVF
jgi:AAA family ATPase